VSTSLDQKYFYTDRAWKALQDELAAEKKKAAQTEDHHGTVGAVALDQHGTWRPARHRRIDEQTLRPHRRLAHHRRGYLRQQSELRHFVHRIGEFWIRLHRRARHLRALSSTTHVSIQEAADAVVQGELKPVGAKAA